MWPNPHFPADLVTFTEENAEWKISFFVQWYLFVSSEGFIKILKSVLQFPLWNKNKNFYLWRKITHHTYCFVILCSKDSKQIIALLISGIRQDGCSSWYNAGTSSCFYALFNWENWWFFNNTQKMQCIIHVLTSSISKVYHAWSSDFVEKDL